MKFFQDDPIDLWAGLRLISKPSMLKHEDYMLEVGMIFSLALMGIYFYKSTDLPKELKERSAQMRAETGHIAAKKSVKMTFPKIDAQTEIKIDQGDKLAAMKLQKKIKEIQLLNEEIDKLTMEITTLEQQIKKNNEKNAEIQRTIDSHLITLQMLQDQISLLA